MSPEWRRIIERDDDVAFSIFLNKKEPALIKYSMLRFVRACMDNKSFKILRKIFQYSSENDVYYLIIVMQYTSNALEYAKILLEYFDINAVDHRGYTILMEACSYLNFDVIEYLLHYRNIDVDIKGCFKDTAIDILRQKLRTSNNENSTKILVLINKIQNKQVGNNIILEIL